MIENREDNNDMKKAGGIKFFQWYLLVVGVSAVSHNRATILPIAMIYDPSISDLALLTKYLQWFGVIFSSLNDASSLSSRPMTKATKWL